MLSAQNSNSKCNVIKKHKRKCEPISLYPTDRPSTALHIDIKKRLTPLALIYLYITRNQRKNVLHYSNMQ